MSPPSAGSARAGIATASLLEGVRFTAQVMLPNVVQGLIRRRPRAVAAATRLNLDGRAAGVIAGLRESHGDGPIWVRVGGTKMLLALSDPDVARALDQSPDPFAPDPDAKRRGMGHFQPDALTISRGEEWRVRRAFAEAVLDTQQPAHRLAGDFVSVARDEIAALKVELQRSGDVLLGWDAFHLAGRRIARRVILGDAARDDEELTDLLGQMMDDANGLPEAPSEHLDHYLARIRSYLEGAEAGSLASLAPDAPVGKDTKMERQLTHWLFALGDTLPANLFRALALLSTHQAQAEHVRREIAAAGQLDGAAAASLSYTGACIHEAMRLWPTTPILSRVTLTALEWGGETVPAGSQVLISNVFNHRDPERHERPDRFEPEAWIDGGRDSARSINHFSSGPQGCPGTALSMLIGQATLAILLSEQSIRLVKPKLDPVRPLPRMLDAFSLRFALDGPAPGR